MISPLRFGYSTAQRVSVNTLRFSGDPSTDFSRNEKLPEKEGPLKEALDQMKKEAAEYEKKKKEAATTKDTKKK